MRLERSAHREQANGLLRVPFDTGSSKHRRFCGSTVKVSRRAPCPAVGVKAFTSELRYKAHDHVSLELTVELSCSWFWEVSLKVCMGY